MDIAKKIIGQKLAHSAICNATAVIDENSATLSVKFADGTVSAALMLQTGVPLVLNNGDSVLVSMPDQSEALPIVLGRIAQYADTISPQDLTLEASHSLTLKCGQGKVIIRQDKVLVKGKEVVSRAKGANQIKGGSVSIN